MRFGNSLRIGSRRGNGILRIVLVALTCVAYLGGCATSSGYTTRAYPTVLEPGRGNDDYSKWMEYYSDQFAALGEKVEPPLASYPDTARLAYDETKKNWDRHVSAAKHLQDQSKRAANTMWYVIGGVVGGLLLLQFVFRSSL